MHQNKLIIALSICGILIWMGGFYAGMHQGPLPEWQLEKRKLESKIDFISTEATKDQHHLEDDIYRIRNELDCKNKEVLTCIGLLTHEQQKYMEGCE